VSASAIKNVLTIAGSDSGGGAGIQADLKTFAANGVYGASVITAVTAQNTQEVSGVVKLDAEFVKMQLQAVLDDIHFSAVKTGMLAGKEIIAVIAEGLSAYKPKLVIDPVMVSTSGHRLMDEDAAECMIEALFPQALLVTPNLPEAAAILGQAPPDNIEDMKRMAAEIYAKGPQAVLLKGGHLQGNECIDIYYDGKQFFDYVTPRIETQNTHGTGCALSSAITAQLAKGETLIDAIAKAKTYVTEALKQADKLNVGGGNGPVNHFYAFWNSLESSR
jgi:hydroxymethylpyrimidine/phosphomethylpyrimidine kinase